MATFGLNNFTQYRQPSGVGTGTGSTASDMVNSTEMSSKMQEFKTVLKGANDVMNMLKQWQNAKTGGDKIKQIAQMVMQSMAG